MVCNATFNNNSVISWRWVLLVEETGVPGENHRPVASHWQTWSHNVACVIYFFLCACDKMINNIYHTVGAILKYNQEIVETEVKVIPLPHIHDRPISCLGTDTSIKSGGMICLFLFLYILLCFALFCFLDEGRRNQTCIVWKVTKFVYTFRIWSLDRSMTQENHILRQNLILCVKLWLCEYKYFNKCTTTYNFYQKYPLV